MLDVIKFCQFYFSIQDLKKEKPAIFFQPIYKQAALSGTYYQQNGFLDKNYKYDLWCNISLSQRESQDTVRKTKTL